MVASVISLTLSLIAIFISLSNMQKIKKIEKQDIKKVETEFIDGSTLLDTIKKIEKRKGNIV